MINSLLTGDLSATTRVLTALAPALLLSAYFLVGFALYWVRYLWRGPYRDAELEKRDTTLLTGLWIRLYFAWIMQPIWKSLYRSGIPANAVTTLSVLLATGSGVGLASGRFALGGWLYMFSGFCDFFDGRLARARGRVTPSGAVLDSILDRYSDAAVLVGLAWYYRDSWVLFAVLLALVGASLVPYIRARGEASGIKVTVGFMQRAERILYLGVAVALSPIVEVMYDPTDPHPLHRLAVAGVLLLAVSSQITALQRFVYLLKALDYGVAPGQGAHAATAPGPQAAAWLTPYNVITALATVADFATCVALVTWAALAPPWATLLGCGVGALLNFLLHRLFLGGGRSGVPLPRLGRYSFVGLTSGALNAGGIAILLLLPGIDYRLGWVLVRAAVWAAWNLPLHRDYVFSTLPARSA